MRNSKLIKSIIIKNSSQQFELSTGYEFDRMLERVSRAVFGKDDVSINESLAIGFLFDNDLFSNLHVAVNYAYFYECRPAEAIISIVGDEADIKKYQNMIDESIEFLKKKSDFLRSGPILTYEDLALSKYGMIAEEFDTFDADLFKKHVKANEFITAMKKHYSVESFKYRKIAKRVLEMIGTYSDIKNFVLHIVDGTKYYIVVKDVYVPTSRTERLQQCVDQIFECNSELMRMSDLTEEEYEKVYNTAMEKDTVLISVNL